MPKQRTLSDKRIRFRHPHYEDNDDDNIFLDLPAFDHEDGGLHHGTALTACGIIACNTWDGFLTETKNGTRVQEGHDDILMGSEYYFHNPAFANNELPYPLFACFNDWLFPHGSLPPAFDTVPTTSTARTLRDDTPATNPSPTIIDRDLTCRISDYGDALEAAHLCPGSMDEWFRGNRMTRYCRNKSLPSKHITADVANSIALRKDIHHCMDDQKFAIVPKANAWTVHFFHSTKTLGGKYHNRPLQQLSPEVSSVFLLTRLAWTIFPHARDFMEAGPERRIKVRAKTGERNDLWMDGTEIRLTHGQSTRRGSQSPTKRSITSDADDRGSRKRAYHALIDDEEQHFDPDATATRIYLWRNDTDLICPSISTECPPIFSESESSLPLSSHSKTTEEEDINNNEHGSDRDNHEGEGVVLTCTSKLETVENNV